LKVFAGQVPNRAKLLRGAGAPPEKACGVQIRIDIRPMDAEAATTDHPIVSLLDSCV
jgi:hypothetical protein